tara:strand:- start:782 stop:1186 length:405 start_codon:yes stop_codon:yes gene_type:complete
MYNTLNDSQSKEEYSLLRYIQDSNVTSFDKLILSILCGNVEFELRTPIKPDFYIESLFRNYGDTLLKKIEKITKECNITDEGPLEDIIVSNLSDEGILAIFELIHIAVNYRNLEYSECLIRHIENLDVESRLIN